MKDWTWPAVAVFGILVAAVAVMFVFSNDQQMRTRIWDVFDTLLKAALGFAGGGAVGGVAGYVKGKAAK